MLNNYHFFGRSQDLTEKYTGMQQENSTERVEKAQDCTIGLGDRGRGSRRSKAACFAVPSMALQRG